MSAEPLLTRRETEVLSRLAEGLSNDEIAEQLVISPNTVKVHLRNIFEKMGVQSRTEATMEAVRRGWIVVPGLSTGPADAPPAPLPHWPPLRESWAPWQSLALLLALLLAAALAWWPNRPAQIAAAPFDSVTSDLSVLRSSPLARLDAPRWTSRAAMFTPRSRAGAALIDGRLYVVGGENGGGDTAVLEMYDPAYDAWQSLPSRPAAARGAAAAALGEQLYISGGCAGEQALDRLDRYDPATQAWAAAPRLPKPRCGHAAAAFAGRLFLFGGWDGVAAVDTLFIFDPASNGWEEGHRLPAPRAFAAVLLLEKQIYLLGGHDGSQQRAEMWVYDPVADGWSAAPPLPEARAGLAVAGEGNSIYVIGGGSGSQPHLHERFDLAAQAWSTLDSPRSGPWHHAVAAMIGPNLHIVGGWGNDYLALHEAYEASNLIFLPFGVQGAP